MFMHGLNLKLAVKSHYTLNHKCISARYIPYFITDHGKSYRFNTSYKEASAFSLFLDRFSHLHLCCSYQKHPISQNSNVCAVTRELIQRRLYMQLMIQVRTFLISLRSRLRTLVIKGAIQGNPYQHTLDA
ncbi:hypothetical protein CIPAW_05G219400 [Carya illinoinensis]|uniref:Uncharacterized protein n=1 Tax=Carya illinoinensis TaxID=32201 RepID=A0A8T1QLY6_CARIL|nr:hypothetical protein CIPAW_05G219400 [Carya illinoinensis]